MSKNLVIVESPAKSKTISKFLGKDFTVLASMGHIRDLPKSILGIETESNFEPSYIVSPDKKATIKKLNDSIKKETTIWIATDEDREGEAIGWHLLEALKIGKTNKIHRIAFHEITKKAVDNAVANPRDINMNLVDAQQARRVLDRLVGYELSPLLWKKVKYGLSAGRVQSVAVRLVVEKEREIRNFKIVEYWRIKAETENSDKEKITFEVFKEKGKNIKLENEKDAKNCEEKLSKKQYIVSDVEKKRVKRYASPPFITSTLQQEASRKLGYNVKKTMMLAQQLYEGVEVDGEHVGLITYMRTDSFNLSDDALKEIRNTIQKEYGTEYALSTPRYFKGKKNAQEAHEAIRPTMFDYAPAKVKAFLDKDQLKLYELIWKRTLACQMAEAEMDQTTITTMVDDYELRASGRVIAFDGFLRVYEEGTDEESEDDENAILPEVKIGEVLKVSRIVPTQHFTKPPARYTEASLIKKLESEGIGRPSTYAPTISTIMTRGYIEKEGKALKPTDIAEIVTDVLTEHFDKIVDYGFTRKMEDDLDEIAEGKIKWQPIIKDFYDPFHKLIEEKMVSLNKDDLVKEETDEKCDKCGSGMKVKFGRFGKFLSCSNYPDCKFARPVIKTEKSNETIALEKKLSGKKCNKCGEPMEVKNGRYGEFLACSGYPKCKNIESIVKPTGVHCPNCKSGQITEKRSKKGKIFYGCNGYPKCKTAFWDKPIDEKCPDCKSLLTEKSTKNGDMVKCSSCTFQREKA